MDRLGFWGDPWVYGVTTTALFQYPLMDRLGFWGFQTLLADIPYRYFSIR